MILLRGIPLMGNAVIGRLLMIAALNCTVVSVRDAPAQQPGVATEDAISITPLPPDIRGGKAYRLVYRVPVPIAIMWKFKTDFDNEFLLHNKYIQAHRLISQRRNKIITEDRYSQLPATRFTWQTTLSPRRHRLDFILLNAQQAGQKFHYGYIQLQPEGAATRITQVAYFDFLGVSLWAEYPWGGGMTDFLTYSAHWEQGMAKQRMPLYSDVTGPLDP